MGEAPASAPPLPSPLPPQEAVEVKLARDAGVGAWARNGAAVTPSRPCHHRRSGPG